MELSKQVCTLEQARKLNDLGVVQGLSVFFYNTSQDYTSSKLVINKTPQDGYYNSDFCFSAFTVAELGVMLPQGSESSLLATLEDSDWTSGYYTPNVGIFVSVGKTEAEVRADLLIQLLANKIVSVKVLNERLSS